MLYPFSACHTTLKEIHSRDTTVLIDLLWFNIVHYFNTFFRSTMVPTLVDNILVYLFVSFFWKYYYLIMIEIQCNSTVLLLLVNCIKTMAPHAPLTYLSSEKKMLCCQLCSTRYTVAQIKNCNFCNQSM